MDCELRADGLHIDGYVNAVLRESRPILAHGQKMNEIIEEHVFERALKKVDNVPMTLDHDRSRILAQTIDKTLELYEDSIGLRAKAIITDEEVINRAKDLKGWSFGMRNITDVVEERAEKLPLRHINSLDLDHVTLVLNKLPCYSATTVELRADNDEIISLEERACDDIKMVEIPKEIVKQEFDNTNYKNRIETLRTTK